MVSCLVHDGDQLERQHVLPQVIARLEHDVDWFARGVTVLEDKPQRQLQRGNVAGAGMHW